MRIGIGVPDRSLQRALRSLLEQYGHEVVPFGANPELVVLHDPTTSAPNDDVATLYLRPAAFRRPDLDSQTALTEAIRTRGVAVWDSPLDVRSLLEVLGKGTNLPARAANAPSLDDAPHAWIVVDPATGSVIASSPTATPLLALDGVPDALRSGLDAESEGLEQVELGGVRQVAVWWTDDDGHRVVCLMPDLRLVGVADDRHVRNLAAIGQMAATLAHEIRNPVASVAGALDLLEDVEDPEERAEIVGMARERLSQMRRLLDDTLRMARPIDGTPEPVGAEALVHSCVSALATDPDFGRMTVRIEAPAEPVPVLAHLAPMQQALTNLLLNAAQAQTGGGRISITVERGVTSARIRIHDEGPGIPADVRDQVFRPFYTTKTEGTGLGLAFVRRVVEATGGTIEIEDTDTGTAIVVTLPRATKRVEATGR